MWLPPCWTQDESKAPAIVNHGYLDTILDYPDREVKQPQYDLELGGRRNAVRALHSESLEERLIFYARGHQVSVMPISTCVSENDVETVVASSLVESDPIVWSVSSLFRSGRPIQEIRTNRDVEPFMRNLRDDTMFAVRGPRQLAVGQLQWKDDDEWGPKSTPVLKPVIDVCFEGGTKWSDEKPSWMGGASAKKAMGLATIQQIRFNPFDPSIVSVLHGNNTLSSWDLSRNELVEFIPLRARIADGVISDASLQPFNSIESLNSFCYTHHPDTMVFCGNQIFIYDHRCRRLRSYQSDESRLYEPNGIHRPFIYEYEPVTGMDRGYGPPLYPITHARHRMTTRGFVPRDYNLEYLRPSVDETFNEFARLRPANNPPYSAICSGGNAYPNLICTVDSLNAVVSIFDLRNAFTPLASIPLPSHAQKDGIGKREGFREVEWIHHGLSQSHGYNASSRVSDSLLLTNALEDNSYWISLNIDSAKNHQSQEEKKEPMWARRARERNNTSTMKPISENPLQPPNHTDPPRSPFYVEFFPTASSSLAYRRIKGFGVDEEGGSLANLESEVFMTPEYDEQPSLEKWDQLKQKSDVGHWFLMKHLFPSDDATASGNITDNAALERYGGALKEYNALIEDEELDETWIDLVGRQDEVPPTLTSEVASMCLPVQKECLEADHHMGDAILPSSLDVTVLDIRQLAPLRTTLQYACGFTRFSAIMPFITLRSQHPQESPRYHVFLLSALASGHLHMEIFHSGTDRHKNQIEDQKDGDVVPSIEHPLLPPNRSRPISGDVDTGAVYRNIRWEGPTWALPSFDAELHEVPETTDEGESVEVAGESSLVSQVLFSRKLADTDLDLLYDEALKGFDVPVLPKRGHVLANQECHDPIRGLAENTQNIEDRDLLGARLLVNDMRYIRHRFAVDINLCADEDADGEGMPDDADQELLAMLGTPTKQRTPAIVEEEDESSDSF